jgi:anti-anti-sigma factor
MNISTTQKQGREPVSVMHLDGKLDSNSFQRLIDEAKKLYAEGARHLILDMTKLAYISSAGIVALHSISKLFRGEAMPDTSAGWNAIRSVEKDRTVSAQQQVKLFNLPAEVRNVLDVVGFSAAFETFSDLDQAVASF